jgi:type II secretory pathway component HofQ
MSPPMRAFAVGLFLGILLVVAAASAAPEPEKASPKAPTVRYRNDKVSVDLHQASVEAVLQALAKESGAELVGSTRAEQPLTMSFEDVPVKEALERLVGAQNFTLKYDESGKLRAIELRGGPEAAKPQPGELPSRKAEHDPGQALGSTSLRSPETFRCGGLEEG